MSTAARDRVRELAGERDVLLASIEDLEREHAAGDVDDADYEALRAGYVARAAQALRAIEALEQQAAQAEAAPAPADALPVEAVPAAASGAMSPTGAAARPSPGGQMARFRRFLGRGRTRVVLGAIGSCCALGLVAIAAAHLAGVRLPGQEATGSVSVPKATEVRQQLRQASLLGSDGDLSAAVALYGTVLKEVPDQPEALAYRGWLVRLAGIADHKAPTVRAGDAEIAKAVGVAPRYADARALYGVALLDDDGQLGMAVRQFSAFLADGPSRQLLRYLGTDMAAAFAATHQRVPAVLVPYVKGGAAGREAIARARAAARRASAAGRGGRAAAG